MNDSLISRLIPQIIMPLVQLWLSNGVCTLEKSELGYEGVTFCVFLPNSTSDNSARSCKFSDGAHVVAHLRSDSRRILYSHHPTHYNGLLSIINTESNALGSSADSNPADFHDSALYSASVALCRLAWNYKKSTQELLQEFPFAFDGITPKIAGGVYSPWVSVGVVGLKALQGQGFEVNPNHQLAHVVLEIFKSTYYLDSVKTFAR